MTVCKLNTSAENLEGVNPCIIHYMVYGNCMVCFFLNHTFQLQHPSHCTALSQTGWNPFNSLMTTCPLWIQHPHRWRKHTDLTEHDVLPCEMKVVLVAGKLSHVKQSPPPSPVLQASYVAKVSRDHVQEPSCRQPLEKQSSSPDEKICFHFLKCSARLVMLGSQLVHKCTRIMPVLSWITDNRGIIA